MPNVNSVTVSLDEGKFELSSVLASQGFARSSRAARLLRYLCDLTFEGRSGEIKEYNIAVDVLGRPETFDPANDASARVEVHRLRKKLKDYYETEGVAHLVRIEIPTGSYVPVFTRVEAPVDHSAPENPPAVLVAAEPELAPETLKPPIGKPAGWHRKGWAWSLVIALAILGIVVGWGVRRSSFPATGAATSRSQASSIPIPPGDPILILSGRTKPYKDVTRRLWGPDQFFSEGHAFQHPATYILGTRDPELFTSGREGNFGYDIPLPKGTYEMRLYFAETWLGPGMQGGGGENSRNFHVVANGRRILSDFDILSDGEGPGIADVRAFKDITPSDDGILRLRFISVTGQAMVNAIEITPSRKGLLNPIRMTAADSPTTDSHGHTWLPDSYFIGGRTNTHTSPVQDTQDPNLYSHERYGRFRYNIPVGDGDYALTLYLAETFWGTENPGGGGPGTRVFDVFCNGVALARDIDIYRRAGANKPLVLHFDGLHPNAQGKLSLSFLPVRNYASVFAIEVEDVTGQ